MRMRHNAYGKDCIDILPTNKHAWLNRAFALTRWALANRQNSGIRWILKIQIREALKMAM